MKVPDAPTEDVQEKAEWRELLVNYLRVQKVDPLSLTVSDPPTQAEVQSIADKVDELIGKVDS